ncbi:hypothetical protein M9Y10_038208 [Tritrichomonas musculus]|uniref:Bacteriophage T5 Orf172 DNA-binding domain-containing protein n=1 Tax=Tritrichomonas musculus TaxID=1915356 RepID=A0ABR2K7V5_9EUKA
MACNSKTQTQFVNQGVDYEKLLRDAIQKIKKLRDENEKLKEEIKQLNESLYENDDWNAGIISNLKEEIIELKAEIMQLEGVCDDESIKYSEVYQENKFLKQRVNNLEQSNNTIIEEIKRMKQKYEITSLETFMDLYGKIMDRGNLKVIQEKYFEETGIKYTQQQLKRELEQIGYQVRHCGRRVSYYVSKEVAGFLYIVQLTKHEGTEIYKQGRTKNMVDRLRNYKRYDGGATEIICLPVNDQFKAEAKFLQLLYEAVDRNELKRNEYGDEYFEGSLDVIQKYYNQVIDEFKE